MPRGSSRKSFMLPLMLAGPDFSQLCWQRARAASFAIIAEPLHHIALHARSTIDANHQGYLAFHACAQDVVTFLCAILSHLVCVLSCVIFAALSWATPGPLVGTPAWWDATYACRASGRLRVP
eukprot:4475029-Amphidinium_carterae.1